MNEQKEITLRPKKWRYMVLVAVVAISVILPVVTFLNGVLEDRNWVIIFGCMAIVSLTILNIAIRGLLPNGIYLRLSADGFTVKYGYRPYFVEWQDVDKICIGMGECGPLLRRVVVVHLRRPEIRIPGFCLFQFSRLPRNAIACRFGMKPEQLANLMNEYLEQFRSPADEPRQSQANVDPMSK